VALIHALSWNLFHGRDHPPDPALLSWRSRLLGAAEGNATHLQLNRDLYPEFEAIIAGAEWDVALLQECPPRWCEPLARACRAQPHLALTSRNSLAPLRSLIARRNPDLIASNEGGSNLTLIRVGRIAERRALVLRPGRRPERRVMAYTRLVLGDGTELSLANLHASAGAAHRRLAEQEVLLAAERSTAWAAGRPLILGGDLNLRPRDSGIYETLAGRFGLAGPTSPSSLDHLLHRGLSVEEPPRAWLPERRELDADGRAIRLSDHAPVSARFALS
jgi:endonuclease/exonuclease/phosphatase family metal-dependent hydrolase